MHEHETYREELGVKTCRCGAVRLRVGEWADPLQSKQILDRLKARKKRLTAKYGTTVDAYGHPLDGLRS